jgi:hypothetical protein
MRMREVIDTHYPDADTIVVVMDNLNTHSPSSFYEVFAPEEARRLTEKLEIHYTRHPRQLAQHGGN